MKKLAVGVIPFLNSKPIIYGLETGLSEERLELKYCPPADCAGLLAGGEFDLALIPSIEYARIEGVKIVPGIAIASRGEVASVLLLSKVEVEKIGSVAVDRRSRTSVALLGILCAEYYMIQPDISPFEPEPAKMLR